MQDLIRSQFPLPFLGNVELIKEYPIQLGATDEETIAQCKRLNKKVSVLTGLNDRCYYVDRVVVVAPLAKIHICVVKNCHLVE